MTPLQLTILLHYRGAARDFRDGDFSAPDVREEIDAFIYSTGMLNQRDGLGAPCYQLTEKGEFFVDQLCAMPLPVSVWRMPE